MEELETQTAPVTPVEANETAEAAEAGGFAGPPDQGEDPADETACPENSAEPPAVSVDELLPAEPNVAELPLTPAAIDEAQLRAALEAIVYVTEEPVTVAQLAAALEQPQERIRLTLDQLAAEYEKPEHGLTVKEVAGGYKMATKPEHHETVRTFVKSLKAPLKLSLPALETLAVVAYKQPVTAPEIMEIRGVQGAGVLKTLLDRKLIAAAGRKNVIGKPILYKTTKEFLVQFGLKDLAELPSLKEFEELRRLAFTDEEEAPAAETSPATPAEAVPDSEPEAGEQTLRPAATAPTPSGDGQAPSLPPEEAALREQLSESDQPEPEAEPDLPEPDQGA